MNLRKLNALSASELAKRALKTENKREAKVLGGLALLKEINRLHPPQKRNLPKLKKQAAILRRVIRAAEDRLFETNVCITRIRFA